MAVWGAPIAHEDDAERAVRAALELVDAVPTLWAPGSRPAPESSPAKAAVTLGATNQGMVAGDLVNTASRLQSVAPAGYGPGRRGDPPRGRQGDRVRGGRRAPAQGQGRTGPGLAGPAGRGRGRRAQPRRDARGPVRRPATRSSASSRTSSTRRPATAGLDWSASSARPASARRASPGSSSSTSTAWSRPSGGTTAGPPMATASASGRSVRWSARALRPARDGRRGDDADEGRGDLDDHVPDAEERHWIEPALLTLLGVETGTVQSSSSRPGGRSSSGSPRPPRSSWSSRTSITRTAA